MVSLVSGMIGNLGSGLASLEDSRSVNQKVAVTCSKVPQFDEMTSEQSMTLDQRR